MRRFILLVATCACAGGLSAQQQSRATLLRSATTAYDDFQADRALDFLRDNGLVHRIESRNAFIACAHNHESHDPVVFLICEKCGAVGEAGARSADRTDLSRYVPPFAAAWALSPFGREAIERTEQCASSPASNRRATSTSAT